MADYGENILPLFTSASPINGVSIVATPFISGFEGWNISSSTGNGWFPENNVSGKDRGVITIDLGQERRIGKYIIRGSAYFPKTWTVKGSNSGIFTGEEELLSTVLDSGTNFSSATDKEFYLENPKSYRFYKFDITKSRSGTYLQVVKLQMMEKLPENKFLISSGDDELYSSVGRGEHNPLLAMTSNASPLPQTASASSVIGANDAWKAFDGISASYWSSDTSDNKDLIIGLGVKKIIKKYQILGTDNGSPSGLKQNPKDWTFEGSNTGSFTGEQVILDTRSGIDTWTASEKKEFAIPFNNREFSYYRLHVTSTNGNAYLRIYELELLATDAQGVKVLKSLDELSFVGHGMDRATEFDLTQELSFKAFIEQSPTTLGSGKVFRKTIDTSKIPIKSVSIT